jgi:hypothetical protein
MNLESYRVPAAVRDGVEIILPDSDAVFRVRLPSRHNRAFTRALQAALFADVKLNPDGQFEAQRIDVARFRDTQLDVFCDHCLIMPLPGGITLDQLRDDYFPALEALFSEAERLAGLIDTEGDAAKKKSALS